MGYTLYYAKGLETREGVIKLVNVGGGATEPIHRIIVNPYYTRVRGDRGAVKRSNP